VAAAVVVPEYEPVSVAVVEAERFPESVYFVPVWEPNTRIVPAGSVWAVENVMLVELCVTATVPVPAPTVADPGVARTWKFEKVVVDGE
jgi:hypothetical protein